MTAIASHLSFEELGGGLTRWTARAGQYYRDANGLWLAPDLTQETLASGWRIFIQNRIVCAINATQGKVRIGLDHTDLNKAITLDLGVAIPNENISTSRTYINIWREITAWGAGSGFSLTIGHRGLKLLLKFNDRTLIPDTVALGITLSGGLTLQNRQVMDGADPVFNLPDLFAFPDSDPYLLFDVPETLNGGQAIIDMTSAKSSLSSYASPYYVDPSFNISPATADTFISSFAPNTNYGTFNEIQIGRGAGSSLQRGLIRFDLSAASGSGAVISADFQLNYCSYRQSDPNGQGYQPLIMKMLRAFVEAEATWYIWSSFGGWDSSGASTDGIDYSSSLASTCDSAITTTGWYHWTDSNIRAQLQAALGGNWDAFLTRSALTESSYQSIIDFCSSNEVVEADRPQLDFTTSATTTSRSKFARPQLVNGGIY